MSLFRKLVGIFQAAGVALRKRILGGAAAVFVEDVFSTFLYTGNGGSQTITNGIDLAGKGGLVWAKSRSNVIRNSLFDTARGAHYQLSTNNTSTSTNAFIGDTGIAFTSTGFTTGSFANTNTNDATYASWTFRKQPKFFDIVTYTGNGTSQTISHALGSTPGSIFVKRTDQDANWIVYHIGLASPNGIHLKLNLMNTQDGNNDMVNGTSSTTFSVGSEVAVNASGGTYVAYLFAHNAGGFGLTGTDNVISCGSFTTDGSGKFTVNLGYEPQWIMIKLRNFESNWSIFDNMRGMPVGSPTTRLLPNAEDAESSAFSFVDINATGFAAGTGSGNPYSEGQTWIYIAIRRPMKVPTVGTTVFNPLTRTGTNAAASVTTVGFPPDMAMINIRDGGGRGFVDKLRGPKQSLSPGNTAAELTSPSTKDVGSFNQNGISFAGGSEQFSSNSNGLPYVNFYLKRAPGFFDIVAYTGNGSAGGQTISHNLAVTPELMIVKQRNVVVNWRVYAASQGVSAYAALNLTAGFATDANNPWKTPTTTTFGVGDGTYWTSLNESGGTFVAYLFATCPGVSKVGSYVGTHTASGPQTINCGFTTGARFVMIKQLGSDYGWWVFDTARGITSEGDPYFEFNSSSAESSLNMIDPDSSGFIAWREATNIQGVTYIFLAIA